jgi:hypothetical protein
MTIPWSVRSKSVIGATKPNFRKTSTYAEEYRRKPIPSGIRSGLPFRLMNEVGPNTTGSRDASISEATTRIQLLNKFPEVKSATISLIRETFVAAQLTHSLVKSQIETLQKHGRIRSVRR